MSRVWQEDEAPEVVAMEMPNMWKDVLMSNLHDSMKVKELCINCGNYHPELGGWCDEKQALMPPSGTCGKFKVVEG